jgi:hypothetical protein
MRFAYIDSQGNEVVIPTEDALRLRIELGAIVETTSFFDGSADRWAPAGEHEVFHRLKRDLSQRNEVGPLAIADLGPEPDRAELPPLTSRRETPAHRVAPPASAEVPPRIVLPADDGEFDFGDFGNLDLEQAGPVPARATSPTPESPALAYDLAPAASEEPEGDPWTVPGRETWPPESGGIGGEPSSESMSNAGFGDEPAPESPASPHPFDENDDTPDWLKDDPEFGDAPTAHEAPPAAFPTREEVRERYEADVSDNPGGSRKRPPPRRPSRLWGRFAAGFIGIAVLGGAGWWLWSAGGPTSLEADVVVTIPPIAPSLQPVFRTAHSIAQANLLDSLLSLPARDALAEEPDTEWLSGRYMATAGSFDGVRLYWETFGRYEQIMRAREEEIFLHAFSSALDSVPLPADDRASVDARALAIFRATSSDREAVYAQLRAVVDAALSLHLFLEQNEDNIVHEPAGGMSRDLVLEAVPITEDLGDEMWNRVAEITSALDALGFLDRVTTERMLDVFFAKLDGVVTRSPPSLQASK